MQTVPETTTTSKRIAHYASYMINGQEVCGIARLVGGGYYFTPDVGESRLVSYKDVALTLYGRCDLADAQYAADTAQGGLVVRTSRTLAA